MFYAAQLVSRDGPLQVLWVAATLDRQLNRQLVDGTVIPRMVEVYLAPDAPAGIFSSGPQGAGGGAAAGGSGRKHKAGRRSGIEGPAGSDAAPLALRLSGQLLLGVCRIYSRKVVYLLQDCEKALLVLKNLRPADAPLAFGHLDQEDSDTRVTQSSIRTGLERAATGENEDSDSRRGAAARGRHRRGGAAASTAATAVGLGVPLGPDGEPLLMPYDEDELLLEGAGSQELHEGGSLELLLGTPTTGSGVAGRPGPGLAGLLGAPREAGLETPTTPYGGALSMRPAAPWSGHWPSGVGAAVGGGAGGGRGGLFSDPPHPAAAADDRHAYFDDKMPDHFEFDLDEHEIEALRAASHGLDAVRLAAQAPATTTAPDAPSQEPLTTPPPQRGQSRLEFAAEDLQPDGEAEPAAELESEPSQLSGEGAGGSGGGLASARSLSEAAATEAAGRDGGGDAEEALAEGDAMQDFETAGHQEQAEPGASLSAAAAADGVSGYDMIDADAETGLDASGGAAAAAPMGSVLNPEGLPATSKAISAAADAGAATAGGTEEYDNDGPPTQPRAAPDDGHEAATTTARPGDEEGERGGEEVGPDAGAAPSSDRVSPPPRSQIPRRAAALRAQAALATPREASPSAGRPSKKKRISGSPAAAKAGVAAAETSPAGDDMAGDNGSLERGGGRGRITIDVDRDGRIRVTLATHSVRELLQDRTPLLDLGRRDGALGRSAYSFAADSAASARASGAAAGSSNPISEGYHSPWLAAWQRLTSPRAQHLPRPFASPNARHLHQQPGSPYRHPHPQHRRGSTGAPGSTSAGQLGGSVAWLLPERPLDVAAGPASVPAPALAPTLQHLFHFLAGRGSGSPDEHPGQERPPHRAKAAGGDGAAGQDAMDAAPGAKQGREDGSEGGAAAAAGVEGCVEGGKGDREQGVSVAGPDNGVAAAALGPVVAGSQGSNDHHLAGAASTAGGDAVGVVEDGGPSSDGVLGGRTDEEVDGGGGIASAAATGPGGERFGGAGCGVSDGFAGPPTPPLDPADGDTSLASNLRDVEGIRPGQQMGKQREQQHHQLSAQHGAGENVEEEDEEETTVMLVEDAGAVSEMAYGNDEDEGTDKPAFNAGAGRSAATDGFTARTQAVLRTLQVMAASARRAQHAATSGSSKRRRLEAGVAGGTAEDSSLHGTDADGPLQVTNAAKLLQCMTHSAGPQASAGAATANQLATAADQGGLGAGGSSGQGGADDGRSYSRMAAARTFYDLLVLSNRGYITLVTAAGGGGNSGASGSDGFGGAGGGTEQCVRPEELLVVARPRLEEEGTLTRTGQVAGADTGKVARTGGGSGLGPAQSSQRASGPQQRQGHRAH